MFESDQLVESQRYSHFRNGHPMKGCVEIWFFICVVQTLNVYLSIRQNNQQFCTVRLFVASSVLNLLLCNSDLRKLTADEQYTTSVWSCVMQHCLSNCYVGSSSKVNHGNEWNHFLIVYCHNRPRDINACYPDLWSQAIWLIKALLDEPSVAHGFNHKWNAFPHHQYIFSKFSIWPFIQFFG